MLIEPRGRPTEGMNPVAAPHHEHYTTDCTNRLYSQPLTHIHLRSVIMFPPPATGRWFSLCSDLHLTHTTSSLSTCNCSCTQYRLEVHPRFTLNRRKSIQSETRNSSRTFSLKLNFWSRIDFITGALTSDGAKTLSTVHITIWKPMRSIKEIWRQIHSIGENARSWFFFSDWTFCVRLASLWYYVQ